MASKPKPGAVAQCLICRDFTGPDTHAAKFPRQQLPSSDVGYLADMLCAPFSSATDKARAIFTWLHHNVDYDVANFRAGTIKPSTPEGTITSGLVSVIHPEGPHSLITSRLYVKATLVYSPLSHSKQGLSVLSYQAHVKEPGTHRWVSTTHCHPMR